MIKNYYSDSLDHLASKFTDTLQLSTLEPFQKPWVIVQNNEIKEWLSLFVAHEQGIAANFKFVFPSEFLWVLYRLKRDDLPQDLPSDINAIQWTLFELLSRQPDLLDQIPFYDAEEGDDWKLFQFTTQLADNFDQYQVYRPRMMEDWLNRKLLTRHKDEKWQSIIWNSLNDSWQSNAVTKPIPRRSEAFMDLLNMLDDGQLSTMLPPVVHVFGLSQRSAPFLELLTKLSKHTEVHHYIREDKLHQLGADKKELIQTWAKPSIEQNKLMEGLISENDLPNTSEVLSQKEGMELPDIAVHSCHNIRREVEVLKDRILNYLDTHQAKPSDILIMVPDADAYSGIIKTQFEIANGEPELPISGTYQSKGQSLEFALSALLNLLSSAYKASDVLEFMSLEAVKFKFDLTDDDLELIEEWVNENKVFRGLGNNFSDAYSWIKGLNQLMSGFVLQAKDLDVFKGLVPYEGIHSMDGAELSAKISRFLSLLYKAEKEIKASKTVDQWMDFVERLIKEFLGVPSEEVSRHAALLKWVEKISTQAEYSEPTKKIKFSLIRSWLLTQLNNTDSSSGRFGQGITLSSYIPYRAIPFKFIAVLGLNESVFPRKAVRPEFDLINADPKPGDRILKEDDSYLFLETLQAAKDQLHLSYLGQDQHTDAVRLPSILIQRLQEDLLDSDDSIIERHSLHPFNPRNYQKDEHRSYSSINRALAKQIEEGEEETKASFIDARFNQDMIKPGERIAIKDFIAFFSNPCKQLAENILGIKEYDTFQDIEDREAFDLKGLERYQLDVLLFDSMMKDEASSQVFTYAQAASMIPEGIAGRKAFEKEESGIQDLIHTLGKELSETEQTLDIELKVGSYVLYGEIKGLFGESFITHRVGSRRAKHEIEHWLKHLILLQADIPIKQSLYLSKEGADVSTLLIRNALIQENPLISYLKWMTSGKEVLDKLTFFASSSKAYAESYVKSMDKGKALKSAELKWSGKFNPYKESEDYYHSLVWRDMSPLERPAFHSNALMFWEPFLKAAEEQGNE